MIAARVIALSLCLLAVGCPAGSQSFDESELLVKASALTKVAAALESAVRFKGAPDSLSEEQLKDFATRHDPGLLEPFTNLTLRVRRTGRYSSALVCTRDKRFALIEDAGCTARLDARLWEHYPVPSCDFQLRLEEVCGRVAR